MPSVKITTYKVGEINPEVTISIPSKIFKIAKKLIPNSLYKDLEKEGVDLSVLPRQIVPVGRRTTVALRFVAIRVLITRLTILRGHSVPPGDENRRRGRTRPAGEDR